MAFAPSAFWNSRSITHLANYPSPSLPMISSDESSFFSQLTEELARITGLTFHGIVVVPGNHDCDFALQGDAREALLTGLSSRLSTLDRGGDIATQLLKVQHDFFE